MTRQGAFRRKPITANERRLLWLWDDTAGEYTFALPLVGTEIRLDESAQAVITTARSGPAETVITRYAPTADGQLQAVQQTQETFLSETETESVTYALIDGEWVLVEDNN